MSEHEVGPMGQQLAKQLGEKIVETIDGFPTPTQDERRGVAALIAERLIAYANAGSGDPQ